jgi:hypothetical protein
MRRVVGRLPVLVMLSFVAPGLGCASDEPASTTAAAPKIEIQINAPENGITTRAARITIRGTVAPPDAQVQILGRSAQVGNGVFVGSVALHRGENTIDVVASAAGAAPATHVITVHRRAQRQRAPRAAVPASDAPPLAEARSCEVGLTAGANTSCAFAENVRAAFQQSGSGVLDVYSPTIGRIYRMYCTAGPPYVCTGGNGASVYFSEAGPIPAYDTTSCGDDVLVGPNTSCAFGRNVRSEYSVNGPGWLSVYSPVTRRTYEVYCTSSSPHTCTGGNSAAVYFP